MCEASPGKGSAARLMKHNSPILLAIVPGLLAVFLPACAPPVLFANAGVSLAEAGTSAFIEGELRAARKQPLEDVHRAYEGALLRLNFPIVRQMVEENYIFISADQVNQDEIQVRLTRHSPTVTAIRIRVGVFGDQAIARLIMEEAESATPDGSAPATPTPPTSAPELTPPAEASPRPVQIPAPGQPAPNSPRR